MCPVSRREHGKYAEAPFFLGGIRGLSFCQPTWRILNGSCLHFNLFSRTLSIMGTAKNKKESFLLHVDDVIPLLTNILKSLD